MTAEDRYNNDSHFHAIVCYLEHMVSNGDYTPSELREAVILAATHHEMRNTRPMIPFPYGSGLRMGDQNISRVEVIDEGKREYVKWDEKMAAECELQDGGRTLKVFLKKLIDGKL